MVERVHRSFKYLSPWRIVPALALGILVFFSVPAWGKSSWHHAREKVLEARVDLEEMFLQRGKTFDPQDKQTMIARKRRKEFASQAEGRLENHWRDDESLSPEEKTRLKRKYQEWKSLAPEKKKILRYRMKKWRALSPEERALYQHRFRQWQQLSPRERERIREDLEKWNGLPMQEKEKIRRRFR